MNHSSYDILVSENRLYYEFDSMGTKGRLVKVVEYSYLGDLNMWNLGFGDLNLTTGQVSDSVVSNNGDGRKVLATVIRTLLSFFEQYPTETVIFTGSDERRTLIYQRIISQYQIEFGTELKISGLNAEGVEQTVENSGKYIAFTVRKQ